MYGVLCLLCHETLDQNTSDGQDTNTSENSYCLLTQRPNLRPDTVDQHCGVQCKPFGVNILIILDLLHFTAACCPYFVGFGYQRNKSHFLCTLHVRLILVNNIICRCLYSAITLHVRDRTYTGDAIFMSYILQENIQCQYVADTQSSLISYLYYEAIINATLVSQW